jgi:hypothetical protein
MDEKEFDGFIKTLGKWGEFVKQQFATNVDPKAIQDVMNDYETFAVQFSSSMSMGRDSVVEIKKSFADAVVSVNQLGGDLNELPGIATDIGKSLNRNVILIKEAYADLYATTKVTGVGTKTLSDGFKDAGFSIYNMKDNMEKVVNLAKQSNVSIKEVSSQVVSNLSMMDKYNFSNGIEGLAKLVTESTKLRVSVSTISGMLDKAFKPDGAIEMAAALQRLGVAQSDLLDPLRLMDMSRNDPVEFQKQVAEMSKSFVDFNEKTKQFEILPGAKEQMSEVAGALGLTAGEFAKMAKSAAEFEDKMKKISFADKFSQEEKELIANMSEMKGGEYMLRVNGQDLKIDEAMVKIQSMGEEERKKFFADTKPKSMEDLAREQLTIQEQSAGYLKSIANRVGGGLASTDTNEAMLQANLEIAKAVPKVFSGERFQQKAIRETVDTSVAQVQKGYESGNLLEGLAEGGKTVKNWFSGAADDFVKGMGTALTDLKESKNPVIKVFSDVATKGVELITSHEKLSGSLNALNTTITDNSKLLNNTTGTNTNAVNNVLTNSSGTQSQTPSKSEITFTKPLEMIIKVEGNKTVGLTDAQIVELVKQGKLDYEISNAGERVEKEKIGQPTK